ncbi:MAG: CPCC family cysteine-rich protein [Peptostreptococcaceae bacterium]
MKDHNYFLPDVNQYENSQEHSESEVKLIGVYECSCCYNKTLPVPRAEAISYICPVCYWQNDIFILSEDEPSDENRGLTLKEARTNFKLLGVLSKEMLKKY